MTILTKMLAGAAGVAALSTAAPAAAQYYGYSPYGYASQQYGYANQYAYNPTQMAVQRCQAAVQNRLSTRTGISGILGAVLGARSAGGRVLSVTQVNPNRSTVRVRGLASSGASRGYGQYGYGAYGAVGYAYQPDLRFKCDVDYRGYVRDIDINRR